MASYLKTLGVFLSRGQPSHPALAQRASRCRETGKTRTKCLEKDAIVG
jgi:hypothetical protein